MSKRDQKMKINVATLRGGKDLITSITFKCTPELRDVMEKLAKLHGDEGNLSMFAREACIESVIKHLERKALYDNALGDTTYTVDTRSNAGKRP